MSSAHVPCLRMKTQSTSAEASTGLEESQQAPGRKASDDYKQVGIPYATRDFSLGNYHYMPAPFL